MVHRALLAVWSPLQLIQQHESQKISWTLTCSKSGNLSYNFTGWHEDIPYFALLVGKSLEVANCLRCKLLSAFIRIMNFNSSMDLSMFAMESAMSYDFQHSLTCTKVFLSLASKIPWNIFGVLLLLNIMTIPWSGGCKSMVVFWGRHLVCIFWYVKQESCGCPGALSRTWRTTNVRFLDARCRSAS